jgi:hypothetical protein
MRKLITILLTLFSLPAAFADNSSCDCNCCGCISDVEFRAGYFYPTNNHFREIYNETRVAYEVQLTQHLPWSLDLFENVTWIPLNGHSIGKHHDTSLDLIPVSVGLMYRFCWCCMVFQVGAGGAYYHLSLDDDSSCECIDPHLSYNGGGLAVKADAQYFFCGCNYLTAFVDYLYLPFNRGDGFCKQVGGVIVGGGIGHSF